MNVFELFGTIAIDHSEAERSLDKTVGSARDAESALEKTFKRIGTYVAAAFSVKAIVDFGKTCSNVFASVAAEESAFAQIMGDYADTAQKKLNAVADQTGITSTRMTGAMTSLTAKFKGLGYNVEDATTLASDGLLIAADAAAFWDMSLDESMSHLNSFINGSYEGGEAIGLFANDTQMAAYAVEKGIVADAKAWAQLDEATKQATRLDYAKAMQQQSGAAGQAAKEADSYANVMANLQASWRQFQSIIGKPILEKLVLPAMRKLNEFMPVLTESVTKGIEWLSEGFDKIASYFSDVFTEDGLKLEALPNALKNMFRDVVRKIPGLLSNVGQAIKNAWTNVVWPAVQGTMKMFFGVDLPGWDEIKSAVETWWNGDSGVSAQIAKVCNWTLNLFGKPADVTKEDVEKAFDGWWEKTKEVVSGVCDWVLKIFTKPAEAVDDVYDVVSGWWTNVKSGAVSALEWTLTLFGVPQAKADAVKNLVSGWWSSVKAAAQGALNWTLKLFSNPRETVGEIATRISTWWAGVRNSAQSVLNWTLKLFTKPLEAAKDVYDVVSGWWEVVKSGAVSALEWTLTLFGVPKASADGVKNLVSGWWQGVKAKAQEALNWTLKLFSEPEEAIGDIATFVSTWWAKVVNAVSAACDWVLQLFQNPKETKEQIEAKIGEWWPDVCSWVAGACNWVLNLFGAPADVTEKQVSDTLSTWWNNTKKFVKDACDWVLGLFGAPDETDESTVSSVLSTWWKNTKEFVKGACDWALGIFNPPTEDGTSVVSEWWQGVKTTIEKAIGIDLPDINLAGIFESATTAIGGIVTAAENLIGNIVSAFEKDEDGQIKIKETLSNLFNVGVDAAAELLEVASNLVGGIVGAITGKEEDAKKVSAFFGDLFGWAGEIAIGVKDGAITLLTWLKNNGYGLADALTVIATAAAGFALSNPVVAVLTALGTFIGVMSTDWGNFEKNHPELVQTLEELTGMDFTNVANTMTDLKSGLEELVTFVSTNKDWISLIMILIGGAVFKSHPVAGLSLMSMGGVAVTSGNEEEEEALHDAAVESAKERGKSDAYVNALETGDTSGLTTGEKVEYYGTKAGEVVVPVAHDLFPSLVMPAPSIDSYNFTDDAKKYAEAIWAIMNVPEQERPDNWKAMLETHESSLLREVDRGLRNNDNPYDDNHASLNVEDFMWTLEELLTNDEKDKIFNEWLYNQQYNPDKDEYEPDAYTKFVQDYNQMGEVDEGSTGFSFLDGLIDWFSDGDTGGSYGGGPKDFETKPYMDLPLNPGGGKYGGSLLQTLATQLALNKEEMMAAMRESMSGMTITATVDTGNITLDTGTLVGAITPKINLKLGSLNDRSSRG